MDTANRKLDLVIVSVFSRRSRFNFPTLMVGLSPRTLLRRLSLLRMRPAMLEVSRTHPQPPTPVMINNMVELYLCLQPGFWLHTR